MPRFLIIFLAVLAVGSFAGMAWMLANPASSDPRVGKLESELAALRKDNERLREQLEKRPLTPAPSTASTGSGNQAATDLSNGLAGAPKKGAATSGLREMMSTPGMKAMLEQQQSMQIDMSYAKLMGVLGLNDEEKAHLKNLLVEREKSQTEMGLKLLDPNLTPAERQKIVQDMQAQRKAYDETVKAFLNDEGDYKTWRRWEDTQQERVQFDMIGRPLFAGTSEPLTEVQEQRLIDLMAEARRSPMAPVDISNPANMDPTQMTPEKIDEYVKQWEQIHESVRGQAASVLSPGQLKTLKEFQDQSRKMAATGLKMSQMMINGTNQK